MLVTPAELTNSLHPEPPALHKAPSARSFQVTQLRSHPERWWLLRADEDWRNKGPWGTFWSPSSGVHQCKPQLPSKERGCPPHCCSHPGATSNMCASELRAGSTGTVICY